MRIIAAFLIGFFIFFFLSEGIKKIFKSPPPSVVGLSIIVIGFLIGFFGKFALPAPINVLTSLFLIGAGIGLTLHHLLSQSYIISERVELEFAKKHEDKIERMLEILPGALTWTALTSPLWLSLTFPFAVAYMIIIADAYWLIS